MPGVTVQFHMLFEELVAFVADAMSRYSLAVELERFSPAATCTIVSPEGLTGGVARFGHVHPDPVRGDRPLADLDIPHIAHARIVLRS